MVGLIKNISFFKERKSLDVTEIREIAACFRFEEINEGSDVMEYGDKAENFYLLLSGIVSVQITNPGIVDWKVQRRDYLNLQKWRDNEFLKRVKVAKAARYEAY